MSLFMSLYFSLPPLTYLLHSYLTWSVAQSQEGRLKPRRLPLIDLRCDMGIYVLHKSAGHSQLGDLYPYFGEQSNHFTFRT